MSSYRFIAAERGYYLVRRLCQVLDVPASGFYAKQAEQQRVVGDPKTPAWETVLVKVFGFHKRRYGTRRLQVALRHKAHRVGRQRLRTAMRRQGLHPTHHRLDPWPALRPEPAVRPAQTHPGQSSLGFGHHVSAARGWHLGLLIRLSRRSQ